jgi:hypothetical protein
MAMILFYLILLFGITHCGDADFSGSSTPGQNMGQTTGPVSPDTIDEPIPVDPPIPNPNPSANLKVIEAIVVDYEFSLDGEQLELEIKDEGEDLIVFLHFHQPTKITLIGDTQHIKALFLTGNAPITTSTVETNNGALFPAYLTATGFYPAYNMGGGVENLVGGQRAEIWKAGAEKSYFASTLGEKLCFEMAFESSVPSSKKLVLQDSTAYTCPF